MVKDVVMFVVLILLLVSIICILNARGIAKNKFNNKNENRVVDVIRVISYIICVCALFVIYYLK